MPSVAVGSKGRIRGTSVAASTTSAYPRTSSDVAAGGSTSRTVAVTTTAQVPSDPTRARATSKPRSGRSSSRWKPDTWRPMRPSSVRRIARFSRARARSSASSSAARRAAAASSGSTAVTPSATRRWVPSESSTSTSTTWLDVRPHRTEWLPQASLPSIPPIVARDFDDGSGANARPCGRSSRARSSRTTPASTVAVRASGSTDSTRRRLRDVSMTRPSPIALPAMLVPPPRTVTGTARSAQARSSCCSSATSAGTATASGATR